MKVTVQGNARGFTGNWDLSGVGLVDLLDYIADSMEIEEQILIHADNKTLVIPKGKFDRIHDRVARKFGYR